MKITRVTGTIPPGVVLKIEVDKKLDVCMDKLDRMIDRVFPGWGFFGFTRIEDAVKVAAGNPVPVVLTLDVVDGKEADVAAVLRKMADEMASPSAQVVQTERPNRYEPTAQEWEAVGHRNGVCAIIASAEKAAEQRACSEHGTITDGALALRDEVVRLTRALDEAYAALNEHVR